MLDESVDACPNTIQSLQGKSKQDEFIAYLDRTGVNELLQTTLMKLIEEKERPEDPIAFIRHQFCAVEELPDVEEVWSLQKKLADLRVETQKTKLKLNAAKAIVKLSDEEAEDLLFSQFNLLDDDENAKSLLKDFLDAETFEALKNRKTKLGGTLWDNIRCGLSEYEHEVGVFASDQYAYETFDLLFILILEELHGIAGDDVTLGAPSGATLEANAQSGVSIAPPSQPELDWGNPKDVVDLDPKNLFIKASSITIGRALKNVRFMPIIKYSEVQEVEEKIRQVLEGITDEEFAGKYIQFDDIKGEEKTNWVKEGILFDDAENRFLKAAGTYSFWPIGRGLFINEKQNLRVWVNEEEHLQVTSFNEGGNLRETYDRLVRFMSLLEGLEFARDPRWGFAAHNLKNIGNTMRVSVKAKIPKLMLAENQEALEGLTEAKDLAVKTLGCGTVEFTNKKRFGSTEIETVKQFQTSIGEIINTEKCFYV